MKEFSPFELLLLKKLNLIIWYLFLVCCCIIIVPFASAQHNFSLGQQNLVCSDLNMTFVECYDFWIMVEHFNETQNNTIYIQPNYTNYTHNSLLENCSNELDELSKIDSYAERGFEPIFENGLIINFKKVDNQTCPTPDLLSFCAESVNSARTSCLSSVPFESSSPDEQNEMFLWILLVFVFLGIVYFFGKKYLLKIQSVPVPQPNLQGSFQHSFISESPKPEIEVAKSEEESNGKF